MILYIKCCPRQDLRTDKIAQALLDKLSNETGDKIETLDVMSEHLQSLDEQRLNYRTKLIEQEDYSDDIFRYAKQFAAADTIVIATPYWDMSFPASFKTYIENIYVTGIVSQYGPDGRPVGMCKANKLYYITTAGGPYDPRYSYDYMATMAKNFLGIPDSELIKAEMLDVEGFDADKIVEETIDQL